jgi:hypothetical protein
VRPPFAPAVRQFSAGPFLPSAVLPFRCSLEKKKTRRTPSPSPSTAAPRPGHRRRTTPPLLPHSLLACPRHPHTSLHLFCSPTPPPTRRVPPLLPLLPTAVTLPSPPPPLRILPSRDPPHDVCGRVLACVRYHMISSSPVAVAISYDSTAARTIPQSPVAAVISRGRHRLRFPWTQPSSLPVDAASAV